MLFSREEVASFINRSFEPVWVSVRPVPLVHIDFGNGVQVTRTLHGNIATYVCTAQGHVLDILPGIYTPAAYLDCLNQFRLLADYVDQDGKDRRQGRLHEYHRGQAAALRSHRVPARFINQPDTSKIMIEGRIKAMLVSGQSAPPVPRAAVAQERRAENPELNSAEDLASWNVLAQDTAANEAVRRRQIHEMLAQDGLVRPEAVTKRLYREVLHADLDDPYLGLGSVLFANYPFVDQGSRNVAARSSR